MNIFIQLVGCTRKHVQYGRNFCPFLWHGKIVWSDDLWRIFLFERIFSLKSKSFRSNYSFNSLFFFSLNLVLAAGVDFLMTLRVSLRISLSLLLARPILLSMNSTEDLRILFLMVLDLDFQIFWNSLLMFESPRFGRHSS